MGSGKVTLEVNEMTEDLAQVEQVANAELNIEMSQTIDDGFVNGGRLNVEPEVLPLRHCQKRLDILGDEDGAGIPLDCGADVRDLTQNLTVPANGGIHHAGQQDNLAVGGMRAGGRFERPAVVPAVMMMSYQLCDCAKRTK